MAMTARRKHSKEDNICIGLAKKSPRFFLKQIQILILFVLQLKNYIIRFAPIFYQPLHHSANFLRFHFRKL